MCHVPVAQQSRRFRVSGRAIRLEIPPADRSQVACRWMHFGSWSRPKGKGALQLGAWIGGMQAQPTRARFREHGGACSMPRLGSGVPVSGILCIERAPASRVRTVRCVSLAFAVGSGTDPVGTSDEIAQLFGRLNVGSQEIGGECARVSCKRAGDDVCRVARPLSGDTVN